MSDCCYLTFTLTGHIPSMEALEAISEALEADGLLPEDSPSDSQRSAIVAALLDPEYAGTVRLYDEQCNYANVSTAEAACQQFKVAYEIDHGAGGEYPAGYAAYHPDWGHHSEYSDGNGAVIPLSELQALLNDPSPLDTIRKRIEVAALAAGKGQPERITADADVFAALYLERDPTCLDKSPEDRFPMSDWQAEVRAGDTVRGYADWVAAQVEAESH